MTNRAKTPTWIAPAARRNLKEQVARPVRVQAWTIRRGINEAVKNEIELALERTLRRGFILW